MTYPPKVIVDNRVPKSKVWALKEFEDALKGEEDTGEKCVKCGKFVKDDYICRKCLENDPV